MDFMANSALSAHLKEIITRASAEIAAAIRSAVSQSTPAAAPPKPAARKSPAPKASTPKPGARKPHPRRSYSDADIERVVALIADKPNLRSEEIKAAVGGDSRVVEKILERLRETHRVQTNGVKRAMTYSIAGSHPGAPKAAKATKAAKVTKAPKKAAKVPAQAAPKAKREWPQCSVAGCGKNMFGPSADRRLCYTHYQEAGGKHYSKG